MPYHPVESNPFRTSVVRPGAIAYQTSPQETLSFTEGLIARLRQHRGGSIVGPHGSGKSTLVHSLVQAWSQQPVDGHPVSCQHLCFVMPASPSFRDRWRHRRSLSERLRDHLSRTVPAEDAETLWVVDGAEQLSFLAYRHLIRTAKQQRLTLLATSHQPLPGLPVLHRTETSEAMIRQLTRDRIAHASAPVRSIVEADMNARDLSAITNVRDYWFDLYDIVGPCCG